MKIFYYRPNLYRFLRYTNVDIDSIDIKDYINAKRERRNNYNYLYGNLSLFVLFLVLLILDIVSQPQDSPLGILGLVSLVIMVFTSSLSVFLLQLLRRSKKIIEGYEKENLYVDQEKLEENLDQQQLNFERKFIKRIITQFTKSLKTKGDKKLKRLSDLYDELEEKQIDVFDKQKDILLKELKDEYLETYRDLLQKRKNYAFKYMKDLFNKKSQISLIKLANRINVPIFDLKDIIHKNPTINGNLIIQADNLIVKDRREISKNLRALRLDMDEYFNQKYNDVLQYF